MAESCIFCALKELFAQFQYSQETALPPDALRRALAETFCDQRRFQLGFMDDAAECFENILMRIHFHIANKESEDMCSASHCIPHQKFAMTLVEQTVCHSCGATSEPLPFTQMVHYVPSSALCSQAKSMRGKSTEVPGFGELLKRAGSLGDLRDCPSSCGAVIQIRRTLMNRPEIVSVGLVWDSERPTIDHIMDVFSTIGMSLKLQDVFHSVVDSRWAASATHQLVGIVTYYGKHYSTFFFHTKLRVWIYFDDAAVREIGPNWEQVVEKCCRGHFQPLLLLYANPYGTSVCTSTAPRTITVVHDHKRVSNGKDLFSIAEKNGRNSHASSNGQRRAVTPNPELSCDLNASVQPRRAVTPSTEISTSESARNFQDQSSGSDASSDLHGTKCKLENKDSGLGKSDSHNELFGKLSDISVYRPLNHYEHRQLTRAEPHAYKSIPASQESQSGHFSQIRQPSRSYLLHSAHSHPISNFSDTKNAASNKISLTSRPASVDDLLHTSSLSKLTGSEGTKSVIHRTIDDNFTCFDGKNLGYRDDQGIENGYISRKTVENVLHLQKLQRQKSVNGKHGHPVIGQRNSSSSLESLDNVFLLRDKGGSNFLGLKLDLPDSTNLARRRDSGNWSGDRNSASSSSTTSLDNPYFYMVNNKRPLCNSSSMRTSVRPGAPDTWNLTDPGYDSFSLSSSDSYPSTITNSPVKLDPRLGQIPEHVQTAFGPYDTSRLHYFGKDPITENENLTIGIKDECERLCIEADIFLAKSVERENVGDISMAALLSDTAAAKARAAMDAPYSNPQSLALAKLKHSMCVIRSSSLHKKLKEVEAAHRRKQREIAAHGHQNQESTQCGNTFNSSSSKDNLDKLNHLCHNEQTKNTAPGNPVETDCHDNNGKSIEIYATLPKKSLKKKGALLSFMESITCEDNPSEKTGKQKQNGFPCENAMESSLSSPNDSINNTVSNTVKTASGNEGSGTKSPSTKKKTRNQKSGNRDSDLSDYSSEWEHSKKSSLYRTYSGPPLESKSEFGDLTKDSLSQTFSGHPTKKQHKIRRKLMGGFMRRKNRSLPDLREGQDQTDAVSRSLDDCVITQTPISLRKLEKQDCRDINGTAPRIKHPHHIQNQMSTSSHCDPLSNELLMFSGNHNLSKHPISHTHSFSPSSKISHPKSVCRAHTPPPYKPPPPITSSLTNNDMMQKRNPLQNDDAYRQIAPQPSYHLLTNDVNVKSCISDKQKKQISVVGRKPTPHTLSEQSTSSSNKQGCHVVKFNYDNEIPKGSAIWLKELQMKQEEIIQKRKFQEDVEKKQSEGSVAHCKQAHTPKEDASLNTEIQHQLKIESDSKNGSHNIVSDNEISVPGCASKHLPDEQGTNLESSECPKSVKDLASKFEKILKPCLPLTETCQLGTENTGLLQQMPDKAISTVICTPEPSVTIQCLRVADNESKISELSNINSNNPDKEVSSDSSKVFYFSPSSGCIYNPHLTEGQLTNMLRIGTNRSAFRQTNCVTFNVGDNSSVKVQPLGYGHETSLRLEMKRPDKPPDYETAIQRLELIRSDRNLNCLGNSGISNFDASFSLLEQAKKKRGPKKSVTFSDKVVLVACGGEEDNDFIPNPLLERVYKQHLMQKISQIQQTDSKSASTQNSQCGPKDNTNSSVQNNTSTSSKMPTLSVTPCHLCHKKTVTPPTVYCPDCAFYMSRFQHT